jgi:predicted DNA-binding transcriptional regulator YafY
MKIVLILHEAGSHGVRTDALAAEFGYQTADAIKRDLKRLQALGWAVESCPDPEGGKRSYYRLVPADTRLAAAFEPEERAQLHRVLLVLGKPQLRRRIPVSSAADPATGVQMTVPAGSEDLDILFESLRDRRILTFTYSGRKRRVHPVRVISRTAGYFLIGVEDGGDRPKEFGLSRMSQLRAREPGTATYYDPQEYRTKDAIFWPVHDPEQFWLA